MRQQRRAGRDFPTSTFDLKAAPTASGGGERSPEASPGRPVLPMLDSRWSMLGAGCTSSVSTGVCGVRRKSGFISNRRAEKPASFPAGLLSDLTKIKAGLSSFAASIRQQNHSWERVYFQGPTWKQLCLLQQNEINGIKTQKNHPGE